MSVIIHVETPPIKCYLGIPVYSGNFFLKYVGRFGAKYGGKYVEFGEICAKICRIYAADMLHICGITEICGVNDTFACVYIGQNAQKC